MRYSSLVRFLLAVLISCFLAASSSLAQISPLPSPTQVIRTMVDEVMSVLRNCQNGTFSVRDHRTELFDIASRYVDLDEIAPRVIGPTWRDQSKEQQEEFKRLFRELVFESYVDRLDSYKCKEEKVSYEGETTAGSTVTVKTRVSAYHTSDVIIEYRLKRKSQGWKIYDVVVEGISIVQNYRSQFSDILRKQSFADLLTLLHQKVQSRN